MTLVGRDGELRTLERALDRFLRRSRTLAVRGELGTGKSSLLNELAARAEGRGHLVATGRAIRRDVPFGLFVDALEDVLASAEPRRLARLVTGTAAGVESVFPALDPPTAHAEFCAHRAIRALLGGLAAERPLVLCLDDVHDADAASQALVAHLLRRPPATPVLLAVSVRPGLATPQVLDALASSAGERVDLGPLTAEAARELLGDREGAAAWRRTGGNPFLLAELATGTTTDVPPGVADAIAAELRTLAPVAQLVVHSAAVAGARFAPGLVAAVADVPREVVTDALDKAHARGIVACDGRSHRLHFSSPLVHRAVYCGAPSAWRLAAHARAAVALAAAGAPAAARAPHLEHAGNDGDPQAVDVLVDAARAASPRAPLTAARWLSAALGLLDETGDSAERRPWLLASLGSALCRGGRLRDSRRALHDALAAIPHEPAVVSLAARVERFLGRHGDAAMLLSTAPVGVPALDLERAWDQQHQAAYDDMLEWARRAHDGARGAGDPALSAATAGTLALAESAAGTCSQARAAFEEGDAVASELDDAALSERLDGLLLLGWYGVVAERFVEAARLIDRGLRLARATRQRWLVAPMLALEAQIHAAQGRLPDAAARAEDAVDEARRCGAFHLVACGLLVRARVAILSGDLTLAATCGEEALELATRQGARRLEALTACGLAQTRLYAGDPQACVELVVRACGTGLEPLELPLRAHVYEVLARAELCRGDVDAAAHWADLAEDLLHGVEIHGRQAEGRRARAAVLLARGDADGALTAARDSIEHAERGDQRIDAARARVLAGQALAAAGRRREAVDELERAAAELADCGARGWADEAARELRRLGRRTTRAGSRGRAATGVAALSGRERQVAELVTAGRTNRQIAEVLFLSEKTVEGYLANVFGKLGVASRAAVAAVMTRDSPGVAGQRARGQ